MTTVYVLDEDETVSCYHCIRDNNYSSYQSGEAFLAGPDHTPYDGEPHHICKNHLDADAVIVDVTHVV